MPAVQPFLPGLEPAAQLDNVFFAVRLAPEAFSRIEKIRNGLRQEHGLKGALISPQRLHVSLFSVCECHGLPDELIGMACGAATSVTMPPFDVVFDRAMSFRNRQNKKPLVLLTGDGNSALAGLRWSLCEAMYAIGFTRCISSHFVPHMTLLYDRRMVVERAVDPVQLTICDFALVHSLVGQSRYIELARWPLRR